MTIRACVMFPVYFTLSEKQEAFYKKLSCDLDKEEYLLELADHYLSTSCVDPVLDYAHEITLSKEQTEEYNKLSESDKDEYLLMLEKE